MKYITATLFIVLLSYSNYAQHSRTHRTYISCDKWCGCSYLSLNFDSTFTRISGCELATIYDTGYFQMEDDTIFLTYTTLTDCNHLNTYANPGHFKYRRDTICILDSLTLGNQHLPTTKLHKEYFPNGNLKRQMDWILKPGEARMKDGSIFIMDLHVENGLWKEYYSNGALKSVTEYNEGNKDGNEFLEDIENLGEIEKVLTSIINFDSITDSLIKQELASFTVKRASYLKTDSLSRIELKEIPVRICSENEVYLSLSTFFSSVSTFIHLYFKGEGPDRMLDSIFLVTHSHFHVKFPQEAFQGLPQPNTCELINDGYSPYFKAFYSNDKKRLYIYMLGGSGSNKYEVTWIIINDRYSARVIDRLR